MANAAVVLQARMGSTRLPGKVLATMAGQTVLARCVTRLQARSDLPVIIATTGAAEDDRIEQEGERLGVAVFRGPVDDVLSRYVQVATRWHLTEIVRATADNPAVDLEAPARTLAILRRTGVDHVVEHGLPYGAAVEAVSVGALRRAAELAAEESDREHVTPLIRRDPRFIALPALAPASVRCPQLRLTVDTPADLAFMRRVFACAGEAPGSIAPLAAIIEAARRAQSLIGIASGGAADAR
jgi:spore coat polysaccharide biosynthesis protein SpsF (cytidylyltransferase family)